MATEDSTTPEGAKPPSPGTRIRQTTRRTTTEQGGAGRSVSTGSRHTTSGGGAQPAGGTSAGGARAASSTAPVPAPVQRGASSGNTPAAPAARSSAPARRAGSAPAPRAAGSAPASSARGQNPGAKPAPRRSGASAGTASAAPRRSPAGVAEARPQRAGASLGGARSSSSDAAARPSGRSGSAPDRRGSETPARRDAEPQKQSGETTPPERTGTQEKSRPAPERPEPRQKDVEKAPSAPSAPERNAGGTGPKVAEKAGETGKDIAAAGGAGAAAGTAAEGAKKAADAAEKTAKAAETGAKVADAAEKTGKAADLASKGSKALDGVGGTAAGMATEKAIAGNGENGARKNVGRYAGAAVAGGVGGAQYGSAAAGVGALPGAALGAAKSVAIEAGKDITKATLSKKSEKTGGAGLGAGGTGPVADPNETSLSTKVMGAGVVAATPAIGGAVTLALLAQKLKAFLLAMLATVMNATSALWAGVVAGAKVATAGTIAPLMGVGNMVAGAASSVFGVTSAAIAPATAAATGVATLASVGLAGASLVSDSLDPSRFDGSMRGDSAMACVSPTASLGGATGADGAGAAVSANAEANAQIVYSVFKTKGMSDENIAGILGNWSQESGIDPTSVESVFNEPYQIGPRKQRYWDGNFTHIPGQMHGGIGLGQWSNDRTPMLLNYAQSKGMDWYTIEAQLAFMLEGDTAYDRAQLNKMVTTSMGSPSAAARFFHDNWERSADDARMMAERSADAEMWYAKMSGWSVDPTIADKIGSIVGGAVDGVTGAVAGLVGRTPSCVDPSTGGLGLGGLSPEEAQEMMDTYNNGDGDAVLNERFNGGGPGKDYTGSYVMNCVSFSWYFLIKYAGYEGGYAPGNGKDVASAMAGVLGKSVSATPTTYSIFSHGNTSSAGHTGVVLAVEGERMLIGEAAYSRGPGSGYKGRQRWVEPSEWKGKGWSFVDVSDMVGEAGNDPDGLQLVGNVGPTGNVVVDAARSQIGNPYVWAGGDKNGPTLGARLAQDRADGPGYDCSGLVLYAFNKAGVTLPHSSAKQKTYGPVIPKSQAQPGDLIYWPGHIGVYSGGNSVIHASRSSNKVVESNIWGSPIFIDMTK